MPKRSLSGDVQVAKLTNVKVFFLLQQAITLVIVNFYVNEQKDCRKSTEMSQEIIQDKNSPLLWGDYAK